MLCGRKPISHIVRHGLALWALLSNPYRCSNFVRLKVPGISLQSGSQGKVHVDTDACDVLEQAPNPGKLVPEILRPVSTPARLPGIRGWREVALSA